MMFPLGSVMTTPLGSVSAPSGRIGMIGPMDSSAYILGGVIEVSAIYRRRQANVKTPVAAGSMVNVLGLVMLKFAEDSEQ